jgi:hypothetical protein
MKLVGFEVLTAVTMKIVVFWGVAPHGNTPHKTAPFKNKIYSCCVASENILY